MALQVDDQGDLLGLHGGAGGPGVGGAPRPCLDLDQVAKEISEGAMERLGAEGAADAWSSHDDTMPRVRGQFR